MATVGTITMYKSENYSSGNYTEETDFHAYVNGATQRYRVYYKIPITYNNDFITKLTLTIWWLVENQGTTHNNNLKAWIYDNEDAARALAESYIASTSTGTISLNSTGQWVTLTFTLDRTKKYNTYYIAFATSEDSTTGKITGIMKSPTVLLGTSPDTAIVTLSKGTGISSVSGDGSKTIGSSVSISATVSPGYTFSKWTNSSGTEISTNNPYTFTMPNSDVSYTANATPNHINIYTDDTNKWQQYDIHIYHDNKWN